MPFLNQRKEENDRRNYFMINLHKSILLPPTGGVSLQPPDQQSNVHQTKPPRQAIDQIFGANAVSMAVTYMPYLTLRDKISQNLAHLEASFHKTFQISQNIRPILQNN